MCPIGINKVRVTTVDILLYLNVLEDSALFSLEMRKEENK